MLMPIRLASTASAHRPIYRSTSSDRKPSPTIIERGLDYDTELAAFNEGGETCSDACDVGVDLSYVSPSDPGREVKFPPGPGPRRSTIMPGTFRLPNKRILMQLLSALLLRAW